MKATASYFVTGLLVGVLLATTGFAFVLRQANLNDSLVLKLGHGLDQSHPVHVAMMRMAELVSAKSGGTVELQVFPNEQLGSETQCIEQLQAGALAMTKTSTAALEGFLPEMGVLGIPYLFRDDAHCWSVLGGDIGERLLTTGTDSGLRGLCFYDAGARSFYTISTPVLTPDDLKGLKIRVQESKTAMDMVTALGGSPTPIAWGELYSALQTKMVDGAENNLPSFYSNRHFEVCKHMSFDEHTRVPDMLMVSEKIWKSLPDNVRGWLSEAAAESAEYQRELWREKTDEAKREVEAAGVTLHYPDKAEFAAKAAALLESHEGSDLGALIQEIRAHE